MESITKQRGLSLPGVLFALVILGFLASIAFKMVPHYLDYKAIKKSVEAFEKNQGIAESVKTPVAFYGYMQKNMEINSIRNVKPEEIMKVERNGNKFIVHIDYERREKMLKNLSLVAHFKQELSVRIP